MTRRALVTAIHYNSPNTTTWWCKGQFWPDALESLIEAALEVPSGFFAAVGNGTDYQEALRQSSPRKVATSFPEGTGDEYKAMIEALEEFRSLPELSGEQYKTLIAALDAIRKFMEGARPISQQLSAATRRHARVVNGVDPQNVVH